MPNKIRTDEALKAYIILSNLNCHYIIKNDAIKKIIKQDSFNSLHRFSKRELVHRLKLPDTKLDLFDRLYRDSLSPDALNRTVEKIRSMDIDVLLREDTSYPLSLEHIDTPPEILWLLGEDKVEVLKAPQMTIIGTRQPTAYGLQLAKEVSAYLAAHGICVVSGMALGIDGMAHLAALDQGGSTIAVLGSGVDVVYPKRHLGIYQRIQKQGLVLSEYPPGMKALPRHFPVRNRLLAGLGDVTIVIESTLRSGTLITCDFALEFGKDVLAVPGSIYSEQSKGTNKLIREGARPLLSAEDLDELIALSHFRRVLEE